jgi:hypothetical protein
MDKAKMIIINKHGHKRDKSGCVRRGGRLGFGKQEIDAACV